MDLRRVLPSWHSSGRSSVLLAPHFLPSAGPLGLFDSYPLLLGIVSEFFSELTSAVINHDSDTMSKPTVLNRLDFKNDYK